MINWLRQLFRHRPITPDRVMCDDQIMAEVVSRAWNTGNMVICNIDDDGNVSFEESNIPFESPTQ